MRERERERAIEMGKSSILSHDYSCFSEALDKVAHDINWNNRAFWVAGYATVFRKGTATIWEDITQDQPSGCE